MIRVGVVVYGFTAQFPLNSAFLARNATVKGDIWLPLTREEDVANAVYLLCKKEASWINGCIIPVDGGEHLS